MIKITDEYYADADKYNWILYKKHIITEQEALKSKDKKAEASGQKPLQKHQKKMCSTHWSRHTSTPRMAV